MREHEKTPFALLKQTHWDRFQTEASVIDGPSVANLTVKLQTTFFGQLQLVVGDEVSYMLART